VGDVVAIGSAVITVFSAGPLHVQQASARLPQLSAHSLRYFVELSLCVVRLVKGNVTPQTVFVDIYVTLYRIAKKGVRDLVVALSDQTYSC